MKKVILALLVISMSAISKEEFALVSKGDTIESVKRYDTEETLIIIKKVKAYGKAMVDISTYFKETKDSLRLINFERTTIKK